MDRKFCCETCLKCYKHKRNLNRHVHQKHKDNSNDRELKSQTNSETTRENTTASNDYDFEENTTRNYLKVFSFKPKSTILHPIIFLNNFYPILHSLIIKNLQEATSLKIQLSLCVLLYKPTTELEIETCFNSKMQAVYSEGLSSETFNEIKHHILKQLENFCQHGSGWSVKKILKLGINFARNKPIRAGRFIPTPTKFSNNNFLLNIRTIKTNNCFELCILAARHYRDIKNKKSRTST